MTRLYLLTVHSFCTVRQFSCVCWQCVQFALFVLADQCFHWHCASIQLRLLTVCSVCTVRHCSIRLWLLTVLSYCTVLHDSAVFAHSAFILHCASIQLRLLAVCSFCTVRPC